MKLTIVLLVATSIQFVNANTFGQKVSLVKNSVTLDKALIEIQKQTGYSFFYSQEMLENTKTFDISVSNASLKTALDICFEGQPLTYVLNKKTIVVKPISVKDFGQDITVTGKVLDNQGLPLPGVTVKLKGTNKGAITNTNGEYAISVPDNNATLVFSFLGFAEQEVAVGMQTAINVNLKAELSALDEIVVIGYGTTTKRDLTGSVSQVKAKEINAIPNANVLQALSGRAAGVQIRQGSGAPGSGATVRIRGGNSILGSNEPLYVIDGFPLNGNPTQINNSDIESVEVLKDASATAIYGSRGANGVVLITTKKGKAGKTSVNFETSYGTQSLIKKLDLMNAKEYATFYNEYNTNSGKPVYFSQADVDGFGEGFDWQDFVFQKAPITTTALNINGGNEKTQFSISGSVFGQEGIVKGSDYNRYSLVSSIDHNISDKFNVSFSTTLSKLATERKDSGGGNRGNSMISAAVSAPPTLTPYNADGSYRVLSSAYPFIATDIRNPINFINEQQSEIKANVVLANAAISYKITPDLQLKIAGGIENRDERTDTYTTTKFFGSAGSANVFAGQFTSLLNENTLSYNKQFNKHKISAVVGFTYQDFLNTGLSAGSSGFLSDIFETYDLSAGSVANVPGSSYIKSVLLSYLGRVNYNYDDKYLATVSLRRDGSSRYSEGSKWGYFPSGALAWRASNEEFLKGNEIISDLKVRTSFGVTGSQAINPYATLNQLSSGKTIFDDASFTTFAPGTELAGDLKWETTEQIDFGFDLGLINNRFLFTADYYIKNTRDLLSRVLLPSSLGYQNTIQNVGQIKNTGLELGLTSTILKGDFNWDLNANIAFNKNKVIKLSKGDDLLRDNINLVVLSGATTILTEGKPVGTFWGYVEDGYDANGQIIFKDLEPDGIINEKDKTYIGNANPDFIYGLNSTMKFKNFELNLFFQGLQGNDVFNASAITNTLDYGFGLNMTKDVYNNRWTPQNAANAKYPKPSNATALRISDRLIEDGSYLRLKNVMLAYNIPKTILKANWISNLTIYASGQNLFTSTNYSWWDPETNFRIDYNSYPNAKSITFGLRAGF
ncbi:TonB-dependent receptor [Pedobacter arcticus]|uniref:TonB-dependent receptor n=1 Tax=Pedobacter arcticus TaxID=752140 RepID=UPI00030E3018|nr:TonB-dependent receptor [Pedobacter arcticus]